MKSRRKKMRQRGKRGVEDNRQLALRDWEGLPEGLLEAVLERLPLGDCLSFSKVCKSWRVVVTKLFRGRTCGIPWLVKHEGPGRNDRIARSCFCIVQDFSYETELPEAYGYYIWGSFQDWLVLAKSGLELCLLNPFSRTKILLPRTFNFYTKMVLSAVPTDENFVCAVVCKGGGFAFWTPGAPRWLRLELGGQIEDVVSYKGCFYFLKDNYSIGIIDIESVLSTLRGKCVAAEIKFQLLPVKMRHELMTAVHYFEDEFTSGRAVHYLVECGGDMLLVSHCFRLGYDFTETSGFETYRLDLCQMTWERLESLGDWVLLVGKCCSRSFPAKQLGDGMANCIYYTNSGLGVSLSEWIVASYKFCRHSADVPDWGIFSLQKKDFSTRGTGRPKSWPSTWVTVPIWWLLLIDGFYL